MNKEEQSERNREPGPTASVPAVSTQLVSPQEEAQPSSVFPVALTRWGGLVQNRIICTMVNATPHRHQGAISSSSPAQLNLHGGGEESRNERLSKKGIQLPSSFTLLSPSSRKRPQLSL